MRASRGSHQSSGLSEISSQFHDGVQRRVGALLIDRWYDVGVGAEELRLRARDVDDRVQADGLGDDAAPSGLERAQDIAVGFGRRRRRQQERVLETAAR